MAEQDLRNLQVQRILDQVRDAIHEAVDNSSFKSSNNNFHEAVRSSTENLLKKIADLRGYSKDDIKVEITNQEDRKTELSLQMPKEMAEEIERG